MTPAAKRDELETCRFCQRKPYGVHRCMIHGNGSSRHMFRVNCRCGAYGPRRDYETDAAAIWNKAMHA